MQEDNTENMENNGGGGGGVGGGNAASVSVHLGSAAGWWRPPTSIFGPVSSDEPYGA